MAFTVVAVRGFLTVMDDGINILLQFSGNPGNNLDSVGAEIDGIYGEGAWPVMREMISSMSGSPEHLWSAYLPSDEFNRVRLAVERAERAREKNQSS